MVHRLRIAATVAVASCLLLMAATRGVDGGKANDSQGGVLELRAAVLALTEKIASLEKRIHELEKTRQTIVISPAMAPDRRNIPEGWRKKEFNGIPYYVVPLDEGRSDR